MERLRATHDGYTVYNAGLPHFPRNFSRDSFIAGLLAHDSALLREQLEFSAYKQGRASDPTSGEEFGKVHHEYPHVEISGLSTQFAACDTTALKLIAHEVYEELTGDTTLAERHRGSIEANVRFILSRLDTDQRFTTSPHFANADRFALKVTYWKDSVISQRPNGEPSYPVIYPLVHAMNIKALRSAAKLLSRPDLSRIAQDMVAALESLWDEERGVFYVALDQLGHIGGISSDSLHMLFYLNPGDISRSLVSRIEAASNILETSIGYRTLEPRLAADASDTYHTTTVWPFEQAIIHAGAEKFRLNRPAETSMRILPRILNSATELFLVGEDGNFEEMGCNPQLWTIAARNYFLAL